MSEIENDFMKKGRTNYRSIFQLSICVIRNYFVIPNFISV